MLNTIVKAGENFCIHQIREPHVIKETHEKKRTLIASIDIKGEDGSKHRVFFAAEPNFVQKVSKIFLEEDESDEETLIDMALETVNLIVGSAKVLASELNEKQFSIETPNFIKIDTFDLDVDQLKTIHINDDTMLIAIKEIDG